MCRSGTLSSSKVLVRQGLRQSPASPRKLLKLLYNSGRHVQATPPKVSGREGGGGEGKILPLLYLARTLPAMVMAWTLFFSPKYFTPLSSADF